MATIAYATLGALLPTLASIGAPAAGTGSLAAAAASPFAASTAAVAGAGAGAAASPGLLGGPLSKIGSMFSGMGDLGKASAIQAGAGFIQGGLAESPRDETEQRIAYNEYLQSQNADPGRTIPQGLIRQPQQNAGNSFYQPAQGQFAQAQPIQEQSAYQAPPVLRLNPSSGAWEPS